MAREASWDPICVSGRRTNKAKDAPRMQIALIMARPPPSSTSAAHDPCLRSTSSRAVCNKGRAPNCTLRDEMPAWIFVPCLVALEKNSLVRLGFFFLLAIEGLFVGNYIFI